MPVHRHPVATTKTDQRLACVPLDHALIARLKASYQLVREKDLLFAEVFYAKLFDAAPDLRAIFRSEPRVQAQKLTASLDMIVRNLEYPNENEQMLSSLGRRHAAYGAKPEHYSLVIELLVSSMYEVLQSQADEQSLDEWRTALRLVSDQMIAGSESVHESKHADNARSEADTHA